MADGVNCATFGALTSMWQGPHMRETRDLLTRVSRQGFSVSTGSGLLDHHQELSVRLGFLELFKDQFQT